MYTYRTSEISKVSYAKFALSLVATSKEEVDCIKN